MHCSHQSLYACRSFLNTSAKHLVRAVAASCHAPRTYQALRTRALRLIGASADKISTASDWYNRNRFRKIMLSGVPTGVIYLPFHTALPYSAQVFLLFQIPCLLCLYFPDRLFLRMLCIFNSLLYVL